MPNDINEILNGLYAGATAFHQGYLNNLYKQDAETKSRNIMDRLQTSYDGALKQNETILGIQQDREAGLNVRDIIPVDYGKQMSTDYLQGLAELSTNPYGQQMIPLIQEYYKNLNREPETSYKFDPLGNLWKYNDKHSMPELVQESHRTKTAFNTKQLIREPQEDGTYKYFYVYNKTDAEGNLLPEQYDKIEINPQIGEKEWEDATTSKKDYREFSFGLSNSKSKTHSRKTGSYTPTQEDANLYNNIMGYYRDGKKWSMLSDKEREDYVKKEKWLADTYFNGDITLLQKTKDTIANQTEKQGKLTLKQITDNTLKKEPDKTKGNGVIENKIQDGNLKGLTPIHPEENVQSDIYNQKKKEYESELKTQAQNQAFDNVMNWFDGTIKAWGRSDLTLDEWLGEIGQEEWNDIEWQILTKEFYKATGEDLNKYFN